MFSYVTIATFPMKKLRPFYKMATIYSLMNQQLPHYNYLCNKKLTNLHFYLTNSRNSVRRQHELMLKICLIFDEALMKQSHDFSYDTWIHVLGDQIHAVV